MTKKLMLSLLAAGMFGTAAQAQQQHRCATDEFHKAQIALHPEIAVEEARINAQLKALSSGYLPMAPLSKWAKTAFDPADAIKPWGQDTTQYYIPMVVHVIYESAGDAVGLKDEEVFAWVNRLNSYYNGTDPLLSGIINVWKPYVGNAHIKFVLANKDPQGKPTRGIVREYSYQSNGGDEGAKISQWPPNQYMNVYLENTIGRPADQGIVLAYATFPSDFSANPYSQGVISRADQVTATGGNAYTLAHEIGHYLSLYHPWNFGGAGAGSAACGDDEVDDTPPTRGHFSVCNLYDTVCSKGYLKDYDSVTYYHMLGLDGVVARNYTVDTSLVYNDSLNNVIGQSFTTGSTNIALQTIKLAFDTAAANNPKIGNISLSLYNGAGTTLIAKSLNVQLSKSVPTLAFSFANIPLAANTTYKFVLDTVGGHRIFPVYASQNNPYSGGTMFRGTNASVPATSYDLYFQIDQLRRIDYPDTNNTQNIMDYSSCNNEMFTRGQVGRMRDVMRDGIRRPLMDTSNLIRTGVMDANGNLIPPSDITPTALFTVNRPFTCRNSTQGVTFVNRSYGDTTETATWTFDKGASGNNSTSTTSVSNTFTETGWVNASLTVSGNGTGSSTFSRNDMVYVADENPVAPYIEEFGESDMLSRYPLFNYFKHPSYNWEVCKTAGYYDRTCLRFRNYDQRSQSGVLLGTELNTAPLSPRGLYADFYTPAYDLSGFSDKCFLSFFSSGAFRTAKNSYINDTMIISYSTNCGLSWNTLTRIGRSDLGNKGYVEIAYEPLWMGDWKEQSINIPSIARTNQVYFRFRFLPGTDNAYIRYNGLDFGTGNNYYLDRLSITENPLSVKNGIIVKLGMSVTPNPTSGAATVRINGGDNSTAEVNVTDVTGKLVYQTSVVRAAQNTEIEIPASALAVKGVYLIHVVTNGAAETQKLVAY